MSGCRQHWSKDENAALRRAVALYGENWSDCAAHLVAKGFSRDIDQCMKHWRKTMDPSLNHRAFTLEEDELLMQEMSSAGNPSLPEVRRRCFPDRSYDRLNSRYRTLVRKRAETSTASRRLIPRARQDNAYAKRSAVANTSGRSEGNEAATQPTRVRVSRTYLSAAAGKSSLSSQRVSGSRRAEATPTSDDTQADSVSTSLEARRLFLKTASRLLDSDDAELREAAKNAMLRYLSDYST